MKALHLLSNKWKKVGWIGYGLMSIYFIFQIITDYSIKVNSPMLFFLDTNSSNPSIGIFFKSMDITNTLQIFFLIILGMMIVFSKEKIEDEYIRQIRYNSLAWAIFVNYLLLFISNLFFWQMNFLDVMSFNMFTPIIIFGLRFQYLLFRLNRSKTNEE